MDEEPQRQRSGQAEERVLVEGGELGRLWISEVNVDAPVEAIEGRQAQKEDNVDCT